MGEAAAGRLADALWEAAPPGWLSGGAPVWLSETAGERAVRELAEDLEAARARRAEREAGLAEKRAAGEEAMRRANEALEARHPGMRVAARGCWPSGTWLL
jgi:hypothetical protein